MLIVLNWLVANLLPAWLQCTDTHMLVHFLLLSCIVVGYAEYSPNGACMVVTTAAGSFPYASCPPGDEVYFEISQAGCALRCADGAQYCTAVGPCTVYSGDVCSNARVCGGSKSASRQITGNKEMPDNEANECYADYVKCNEATGSHPIACLESRAKCMSKLKAPATITTTKEHTSGNTGGLGEACSPVSVNPCSNDGTSFCARYKGDYAFRCYPALTGIHYKDYECYPHIPNDPCGNYAQCVYNASSDGTHYRCEGGLDVSSETSTSSATRKLTQQFDFCRGNQCIEQSDCPIIGCVCTTEGQCVTSAELLLTCSGSCLYNDDCASAGACFCDGSFCKTG